LLVLSAIALATASSDGADDLVLTEEFPQLLLLVYFDTLDDDGFDEGFPQLLPEDDRDNDDLEDDDNRDLANASYGVAIDKHRSTARMFIVFGLNFILIFFVFFFTTS